MQTLHLQWIPLISTFSIGVGLIILASYFAEVAV